MLYYIYIDKCAISIKNGIITEIYNIFTNKTHIRIGSKNFKFIIGKEIPVTRIRRCLDYYDTIDNIKVDVFRSAGLDINYCGVYRKFNHYGILIEEYFHNNGNKEGNYKSFYDSGILKMEGFYLNNKLNGVVKKYNICGKIKSESTYDDNILNGTTIEYFDPNYLDYYSTYTYRNNVRYGEYKIITDNHSEIGIFENDFKIESIKTNKNNILVEKIYKISPTHYICENYKISNNKNLLENKKIYCYKTNKLDGLYQEYFMDGTIRIQCNYQDHKKSGEYIEYYINGKIYKKIFYKNDNEYNKKVYNREGEIIEYLVKNDKSTLLEFRYDRYDSDKSVLTEFLNEFLNELKIT